MTDRVTLCVRVVQYVLLVFGTEYKVRTGIFGNTTRGSRITPSGTTLTACSFVFQLQTTTRLIDVQPGTASRTRGFDFVRSASIVLVQAMAF